MHIQWYSQETGVQHESGDLAGRHLGRGQDTIAELRNMGQSAVIGGIRMH